MTLADDRHACFLDQAASTLRGKTHITTVAAANPPDRRGQYSKALIRRCEARVGESS